MMNDGTQKQKQHRKLLCWLRMLLLQLILHSTLTAGFSPSSAAAIRSRSRHIFASTCTHMANIRGVRHTNTNYVPRDENGNDNDFSPRRSSSTSSSSSSSSSPYSNSNGHDYERVSLNDNVNIDEVQINSLLSDRLRARKTGDFETADRIRDQLSNEHRVTVYDKDKVWEVRQQQSEGSRDGRMQLQGRGGRGGRSGRSGGSDRGIGDRAQRKRNNFGQNGHDYELSREAGPCISVVDNTISEQEIHRKIAERLMAKMNRDFETADRVQLALAEVGVYINDRTKEWRADGVRFIDPSEGRTTRNGKYGNDNGKINRDQNRPYIQSEYSSPFLKQHEDGRFDTIQDLVNKRVVMKKERQYAEADAVRDTLQRDFNVLCDDRIRQWTMGNSFGTSADLKRKQDDAIKSRGYIRSQFSLELPDKFDDAFPYTIDDIQKKVNQRTGAKMDRRYAESDTLRDELKDNYNVIIHDKIKMWSIGGDFGTDDPGKAKKLALRTYVRRGGGELSEKQLEEIQELLLERVDAKMIRNFVKSDEIRSYLYETYNINISDPDREWRVLTPDNGVMGYVQVASGPGATRLTNDEVGTVEYLLVERANFKKNQAYEEADDIRDDLERKYAIIIDDKSKEWRVTRSNRYNNSNSDTSIGTSTDTDTNTSLLNDIGRGNDDSNSNDVGSVQIEEGITTSVSSPTESLLTRDELTALTVPMLKEKLREAGKPVSGKKIVLIDRLLSDV